VSGVRELEKMTWAEARDAAQAGSAVMVVVASTEQHGPHLPLGTDAIVGQALALAAADGLDVIVAPAVRYGYRSRPFSGGGQSFPGTVSVRGTTLIAPVTDLINEFRRTGFRKIVVFAHHSENQNFIYEAAYEAVGLDPADGAQVLILESPYPDFEGELGRALYGDEPAPGPGLDHAAIVETALVMHVAPELVREDLVADDGPPNGNPGYDLLPIPDGFTARSGVLSKAVGATPELGAQCFSEVAAHVRSLIVSGLFDERSAG